MIWKIKHDQLVEIIRIDGACHASRFNETFYALRDILILLLPVEHIVKTWTLNIEIPYTNRVPL